MAGDFTWEVPRSQRRPLAKAQEDYKQECVHNPHAGMVAAYMTGDYTIQQIAAVFGVHYATVSRAIKRHEMHDCKT